jgi:hypothetical protein
MKKRLSFFQNMIFWTATGVVITGLLCWVAYSQLAESNLEAKMQNKIAAETFLHGLKTDFFTQDAKDLIFLMEINGLQFSTIKDDSSKASKELAIFKINLPSKFVSYVNRNLLAKKYFTSDEIDIALLNHFEDLGVLYKKRLIDTTDIYEYFSYYVTLCHEDRAINSYIKWARKDANEKDVFDNFDAVYTLVQSMNPIEK